MGERPDLTRSFVLRALAASEIADSCLDGALRRSFTALAEHWLREAAERSGEPPAGRDEEATG